MRLPVLATFWGCFWATGKKKKKGSGEMSGSPVAPSQAIHLGTGGRAGYGLQIQCYQCEEFLLNNDCSSPEFIVNCTVNVQDMCQKEVIEKSYGIMYRKSCASSGACLITSAGYQSFCAPGKLDSVCISCCNTPLCNGPRLKKRVNSAAMPRVGMLATILPFTLVFISVRS